MSSFGILLIGLSIFVVPLSLAINEWSVRQREAGNQHFLHRSMLGRHDKPLSTPRVIVTLAVALMVGIALVVVGH